MPDESTSPDPVELTQCLFEAADRRDLDAMMSLYTPDAVWDLSRLGIGIFEGGAAIRGVFEDQIGAYDEYEIEVQEIFDLGHVVFVAYQEDAHLTGSAGHVRERKCWLGVFVEGLASRGTFYQDIDEGRAAAERLAQERGQAVSRENVELVIKMHPAQDVNMAELFRNDGMWSTLADRLAPFFHTDFECVAPGLPHTERVHVGIDGFRAAWLAWLQPWLTYRTEIKQTLDAGDRVLVLVHDYGRREGSTEEIKVDGSGVWTVRDRKIARAEFFALRAEAFEAAGLPAE